MGKQTTKANVNTDNSRIDYFDMAKGIGIICIVIYHILGSLSINDEKAFYPALMQYIASFALPVFFVISGMLSAKSSTPKKNVSTLAYAKKKFRGLIIPYFTFSIICLLIMAIQVWTGAENVSYLTLKNSFIAAITFRGISVLWFLPALFVSEIVFFQLKKLKFAIMNVIMLILAVTILSVSYLISAKNWNTSTLMYIVGCLTLTIGRIFLALSYLWIGYLFMIIFKKWTPSKILVAIIGTLLLAATYPLSRASGGIDINTLTFGNSYVTFAAGIIGSIGLIMICMALPKLSFLTYAGKNSLIIMASHMDFCVIAGAAGLAYYLLNYIPKAKLLALYFMILLFVTILEILIISIFNKFFSKLIGK